jgi:hypothetical protein
VSSSLQFVIKALTLCSVEVSFVSPVSSGEGFQTALNRAADIVKSVIAAK